MWLFQQRRNANLTVAAMLSFGRLGDAIAIPIAKMNLICDTLGSTVTFYRPGWCISTIMIRVIIGCNKGLSPDRYQAITWTFLLIYLINVYQIFRNKLQWTLNRFDIILIQKDALESIVCTVSAILFRHQRVNPVNSLFPGDAYMHQ